MRLSTVGLLSDRPPLRVKNRSARTINNRIKVMRVWRTAYGYRDSAYFFLKIKAAYPGNP